MVTSRDSLAGLVLRHGARRTDLDLVPSEDAIDLLRRPVGERVEAEPAAALSRLDVGRANSVGLEEDEAATWLKPTGADLLGLALTDQGSSRA